MSSPGLPTYILDTHAWFWYLEYPNLLSPGADAGNPDAAPHLAERDVDLLLCGHTHGGQVSIPFLGPPILPVENREYVAGLYRVGETALYVNRGVGWLRRVQRRSASPATPGSPASSSRRRCLQRPFSPPASRSRRPSEPRRCWPGCPSTSWRAAGSAGG